MSKPQLQDREPTAAPADRELTVAELANYKHAFETTALDRDHVQHERDLLTSVVTRFIAEPALLRNFTRPSRTLPPSPRPLAEALATVPGFSPEPDEIAADLYLPNVYCVGAPKSCTSFFYSILRQHPNVFVSDKDSGRIIDLTLAYETKDSGKVADQIREFASLEASGYRGQPVFCNFEAGFYIYPSGPEMIARHLQGDARILIFLRDPIKRLISEYTMRTRQFDSSLGSFVEPEELVTALSLAAERRATRPRLYSMYYAYTEMSDYAELVKAYIDRFGASNVKVVIMELDVVQNLEASVLECFSFLGLTDIEAVKIAFTDHKKYADMSRMPSEMQVRFVCTDGGAHVDPIDIEPLLNIGVERIEICSDVPQQLDLVIKAPDEATIRAATTLASRHAIKLSVEEERDLYDAKFRHSVHRLERLISRDLSCWYRRYAEPV